MVHESFPDPLDRFRLDDRVAIVTGASSGLGHRFARVLDRAGARLVLAARRAERLEVLAGQVREAAVAPCDLEDPSAAERLVVTAIESYGVVDIVVNNAGITGVGRATEISIEDFSRVLAVDLVAPFALARAAARTMIESGRGGVIVNVASVWGLGGVGQVPHASYAAAKGGLVNLTRQLAAEWARKGVRVNTLAPGWFRTEMTEGTMFGDEDGERFVRNGTPMGRGGHDHELDGALLYLASDASSFVTGIVLPVDGGWSAV